MLYSRQWCLFAETQQQGVLGWTERKTPCCAFIFGRNTERVIRHWHFGEVDRTLPHTVCLGWMNRQHVIVKIPFLIGTVWAKGAAERLLPAVDHEVAFEVVFGIPALECFAAVTTIYVCGFPLACGWRWCHVLVLLLLLLMLRSLMMTHLSLQNRARLVFSLWFGVDAKSWAQRLCNPNTSSIFAVTEPTQVTCPKNYHQLITKFHLFPILFWQKGSYLREKISNWLKFTTCSCK